MTNLGLWEPTYRSRPAFPYGTDKTYLIGAKYLSCCQTVEDWGCGTQWFRRVMNQVDPTVRVLGLDGSAGFCDRVVDLHQYIPQPRPEGIFLRHVLEHNREWRTILEHALTSFEKRMVLVLFTPFSERETLLSEYSFPTGGSCPYLSLSQAELGRILYGHGLHFRVETMPSPETEFGLETVYWISRSAENSVPEIDRGPAPQSMADSNRSPFVSCLCPTYCRPELLANALACYLAQDYPADRRELIILDDAGQFQSQNQSGWELVSVSRRFRSLPEKFNCLAGLARGEVLVVWEDDDIYLPWHVSAHVAALRRTHGLSKPVRVRSHLNGRLHEEEAAGRFHASIAMTRDALQAVQGWPMTLRSDFDQQLLARLESLGQVGNPLEFYPPSYIFRWEATGAYHGQALMRRPEDEEWYARAEMPTSMETNRILTPRFDEHTRACFADLKVPCPA